MAAHKLQTTDRKGVAKIYDLYRMEGNTALYIGPNHNDLVKEQIVVKSTSPKSTVSGRGNRRSSMNFVQGQTLKSIDGKTDVVKDMKVELSVSIPAGTSFDAFAEQIKNLTVIAADDTMLKSIFYTGALTL